MNQNQQRYVSRPLSMTQEPLKELRPDGTKKSLRCSTFPFRLHQPLLYVISPNTSTPLSQVDHTQKSSGTKPHHENNPREHLPLVTLEPLCRRASHLPPRSPNYHCVNKSPKPLSKGKHPRNTRVSGGETSSCAASASQHCNYSGDQRRSSSGLFFFFYHVLHPTLLISG